MTELRFTGGWPWWAGAGTAFVLALAAAAFYWRETRTASGPLRWLLPLLRGLAVLLLLLIFTGPVLHHSHIVGDVARLLLFVDNSQSMALNDAGMEAHRKLLVAGQLGRIPAGAYDPALRQAHEALLPAPTRLPAGRGADAVNLAALATNLLAAVENTARQLERVRPETWPNVDQQRAKFRAELLLRATELVAGNTPRSRNKSAELNALAPLVVRWQRELQNAYDDYLRRLASGSDRSIQEALAGFDRQTRWERLEALLFGTNLVEQLAGRHRVEIRTVSDEAAALLWRGGLQTDGTAGELPTNLLAGATNRLSDLGAALLKGVDDGTDAGRTAVVVFSDGQHNSGRAPVEVARQLGNRSVPVHTVGFGPAVAPEDLAVVGVNGPDSVFVEDRLKGEVVLKDDLAAGQSFLLKIDVEGRTVWAKTLPTEQRHRRTVAFDLPVKELARGGDTNRATQPVTLAVSAVALQNERLTNNNMATFRFQAVRQRPKVLVLEGRPRWDYRYLRNLLERDSQWEVNALLADTGSNPRPWTRGTANGTFPADRETLFGYQLVFFGDVPPAQFRPDELVWLKEFVESRGGGILFMDGRQETLASYAATPLGSLLPVKWQETALEGAGIELKLTGTGLATTALSLAPGAAENEALWNTLPPPRWVAPAAALPGTDTLLTAALAGRAVPALVFRRQGAGRVLYFGFDETWRWRYEHADRYHQRLWNQLARWIMDAPYPAADRFVSLDSGALTYRPGEAVDIRAQVRDAQGKLLPKARVEAQLFRDGRKAASVQLAGDDSAGGIYRGRTEPLPAGSYEVYIRVEGLPESEMKARTTFVVEPREASELVELTCNEDLLRQMARVSGGEYFREEEATGLIDKLAPLSRGKLVETETVLWHRWEWLAAIALLLGLEWFLRKRAGML